MLKFLKLFADQQESLTMLDDETCGQIVKAMMRFAFQGEDSMFDNSLVQVIWMQYRNNIILCNKKAEAGSLGGKKTQATNKDASSTPSSTPSSTGKGGLKGSLTVASSSATITPSSSASSKNQANDEILNFASNVLQPNIQEQEHIQEQEQIKEKEIEKEKFADGLDELSSKTQKPKRKKSEPAPTEEEIAQILDEANITGDVRREFNEFVRTRNNTSGKQIKTKHTVELLVKRLRELADTEKMQIRIIQQSNRKGYMDFFPLKEETFGKQINSVADVAKIPHRNPFAEAALRGEAQ